MDLSCWMSELEETVVEAPFLNLAIPGSHDSLTYTIKPTARLSPDADPMVLYFQDKPLEPLICKLMYQWSVTQTLTVTEQLQFGIRYFDVRLATKKEDKGFYIVHGMYGDPIDKPLIEIAEFIRNNAGEVCIVDLQHFYDFCSEDHARLSDLVLKVFNGFLCPSPDDITTLTLGNMRRQNQRVIVVYRSEEVKESLLWTSSLLPTPWPNTMSPCYLLEFLSNGMSRLGGRTSYVSQCVLTPSRSTVLITPCAGVHHKCAYPAAKVILPWLESLQRSSESPPLNIVIADFVHDDDIAFPRAVIALNQTSPLPPVLE